MIRVMKLHEIIVKIKGVSLTRCSIAFSDSTKFELANVKKIMSEEINLNWGLHWKAVVVCLYMPRELGSGKLISVVLKVELLRAYIGFLKADSE